MEFLSMIKWYHIVIISLVGILLFLVLTGSNCNMNLCKNALLGSVGSEGFNENNNNNNTQEEQQPQDKTKGEIIIYYAMWCGYSRQFLPEWEKFEKYAKDNLPQVRVSRVRCEDGNEATCQQKGVQGYPTVILYLKDGSEKTFEDERNMNKLIEFVQKNV